MSPVGGSRHYTGGAGLGHTGAWDCPACGAENLGPIEQGCVLCGAGKPGRKVEPATPPPRVSEPDQAQGDVADHWASQHPDISIAEAYRAGYLDGVRAARAATETSAWAAQKVNRTIAAALSLFRDQVLADAPEETTNGEWLNAAEVDALITQLIGETTHA